MSERTWHVHGRSLVVLSAVAVLAATTGCVKYKTPGAAADLASIGLGPDERAMSTDNGLRSLLDRKPTATFPASIAVTRIQSPGYRSHTGQSWGRGNYSVVMVRDVETDEHFDRIAALDGIASLGTINRLLLRHSLESSYELREAAAQLHADMLLIYTFDTAFTADDHAEPLTIVTLGLFPAMNVRLHTTATAVLMDTRNGYIYGLCETSAHRSQLANAWTSDLAIDESRRKTEAEAFDKLVGEFEQLWPQIVAEYSRPAPVAAAP